MASLRFLHLCLKPRKSVRNFPDPFRALEDSFLRSFTPFETTPLLKPQQPKQEAGKVPPATGKVPPEAGKAPSGQGKPYPSRKSTFLILGYSGPS